MSVFICRLSTQICLLLLKPRDVKLHSSLKRLNVILKSHTKKRGDEAVSIHKTAFRHDSVVKWKCSLFEDEGAPTLTSAPTDLFNCSSLHRDAKRYTPNRYLEPLHRIPAGLPNKSILFLIASVWEVEAPAEGHPVSRSVLLTASILLCCAGIKALERQQPLERTMCKRFRTRRVPARLF